MKQSTFVQALKFATHAMAKKDVRYYLNGVCFEFLQDGGLTLVATDGHRMAVCSVTGLGECSIPPGQYIVSSTDVDVLLKILDGKNTSPVWFARDASGSMAIESYGRKHSFVPVDAKFPEWRRVARIDDKAKPTPQFCVNADYLASACKAAGALSDRYHGVRFTNYGDCTASFRVEPQTIKDECIYDAFAIIMSIKD